MATLPELLKANPERPKGGADDHLVGKRYRVRRLINGKLKVLGELPVNGDPSLPEFQAAYHALLRGEKIRDAGCQRDRALDRARRPTIE